jgi:hypothetical protein
MYASSEFISGELQNARMLLKCPCAIAVPILPVDAPMIAEGFRVNELCPLGRLAQSMVVAVERKITEGDFAELQLRRRDSHERVRELAIDRFARQTPDEVPDVVGGHATRPWRTMIA